ncbi:ribonuclease H family protein [Leptolyngbya sp. AN02str]|uniref:ribonuclease H family protein n=1 Tax=Leptolyngbya sp. AN02str TaxID=3423363 RepID=UPI003D323D78
MQVPEFDVKTGLPVLVYDPRTGQEEPSIKEVQHSYLEHWLKHHGLLEQSVISYAQHTKLADVEIERLEQEGRVLVFTNGKDGYFADPTTATLIREGSVEQGITSIYGFSQNSPHNYVAYGSLVGSDGYSSTSLGTTRILVIDDEARSLGDQPILDTNSRQVDVTKLLNKMGDGTMLVSQPIMQQVILPKEQEEITEKIFQKFSIDATEIADLAQEYGSLDDAQQEIERGTKALSKKLVTQFRAATPDYSGIAKGTMAYSRWCERLGVDAIISKNDIKGDDGRFSTPGIHEVSSFWVNRKERGQYSNQGVGPQVKGCIPYATLHEFMPKQVDLAKQLEQVASDPQQLKDYYIAKTERERQHTISRGETPKDDWLYDTLQGDSFDLLRQNSVIVRELQKKLKGAWTDTAIRGVELPSAMAQHHALLKPWEVCNKDLPHGAIVAYYRSPFPNVGAAAIAVNNTQAIRRGDPESLRKQGVAYLHPWTAKNIAITDFDADLNGYFVGYTAVAENLPEQIREQLAHVESKPPAEQYEAGRSLFSGLIDEWQTQNILEPADYPIAVKEIIDLNIPERKPPEIKKQAKVKHPWYESESYGKALHRAWEITADNPTGKVANSGMTLQSYALECELCPPDRQRELLAHIKAAYKDTLFNPEKEPVIPTDTYLVGRGFPPYHFKERLQPVVDHNGPLTDVAVKEHLSIISDVLVDVVSGPIGENLQTAVDTAKSSRGIDDSIHAFAQALTYKEHALRAADEKTAYLDGSPLPTNTEEPIGWSIQAVNTRYERTRKIVERDNEEYRSIIPLKATQAQQKAAKEWASRYTQALKLSFQEQERTSNRRTDQQPTFTITSESGKVVTIERTADAISPDSPLWRYAPERAECHISTVTLMKAHQWREWPEPMVSSIKQHHVAAIAQMPTGEQLLGLVSQESVDEHHLMDLLARHEHIPVANPIIECHPAKYLRGDSERELAKGQAHLWIKEQIRSIPNEEREAFLSAFWHTSTGMKIALKHFSAELVQQLETPPPIRLIGLQYESNQVGHLEDGIHPIQFTEFRYSKNGQEVTQPAISVVQDGEPLHLGAIDKRSVKLPIGWEGTADIHVDASGKFADIQVLEAIPTPEPAINNVVAVEFGTPHQQPDFKVAETGQSYDPQPSTSVQSLQIATDGSCLGNPGPGGWAAVLLADGATRGLEIGGREEATTNNRMELKAVIEALRHARTEGMLEGNPQIEILSDSQVVGKGITGEWKRKTNLDLWAEYDEASQGLSINVTWVKGHSGHVLNERVDAIANAFASGQPTELWSFEQSPIGSAQAQTILLPTEASHCLYGFANNDVCEDYQPTDSQIQNILEAAYTQGYAARCERIEQGSVSQTIVTIDFPDTAALKQFEAAIAPLPIQYRYKGDLSAGVQFVEPLEHQRLNEASQIPVPDDFMIASFIQDEVFEALGNEVHIGPSPHIDGEVQIAGKPVKMVFPLSIDRGETNQLPVSTCIEAMRGYGRTHTTRSYEPYHAYEFEEGELAIAQGYINGQSHEVAFIVGEQYRITSEMIANPEYQRYWSAVEKHSVEMLKSFEGKEAWGLTMQPLGDYIDGQIVPFPDRSAEILAPTRQELLTLVDVAIKAEHGPLKEQIRDAGLKLNAVYCRQNSRKGHAPVEFKSPSVALSTDVVRQIEQLQQVAAEPIVHPTISELRGLYLALSKAQKQANEAAPGHQSHQIWMDEIRSRGIQLRQLYGQQGGEGEPPLDYRHAGIILSPALKLAAREIESAHHPSYQEVMELHTLYQVRQESTGTDYQPALKALEQKAESLSTAHAECPPEERIRCSPDGALDEFRAPQVKFSVAEVVAYQEVAQINSFLERQNSQQEPQAAR